MKEKIRTFIENVSSKDLKDVLKNHLYEIIEDKTKQRITLLIDKKYAMNVLRKPANLVKLIKWIYKKYWVKYKANIRLKIDTTHHDREMMLPHIIHYG